MKRALAKFILHRLMGWKIVGNFPENTPKGIIVVGPHTSNIDFLLGILTRNVQGFNSNFVIKDTWTKMPIIGSIVTALGGQGVDREKNTRMTDKIVQIFKDKDHFVTSITPEGTRSYNPNWKTGFWYIAKEASVPLIPVALDYGNKEIVWGEPFYPSDDKEADIKKIKDFFKQYKGKYPEKGVH